MHYSCVLSVRAFVQRRMQQPACQLAVSKLVVPQIANLLILYGTEPIRIENQIDSRGRALHASIYAGSLRLHSVAQGFYYPREPKESY